jgi:hypothetical protein
MMSFEYRARPVESSSQRAMTVGTTCAVGRRASWATSVSPSVSSSRRTLENEPGRISDAPSRRSRGIPESRDKRSVITAAGIVSDRNGSAEAIGRVGTDTP